MHRQDGGPRGIARLVELALLIALPVLFHLWVPVRTVVPRPYSYPGAAVMLGGLALMNSASSEFRKAGTRFDLQGGGSALVTSGPYRFSRNPIYVGMFVWLLGLAVLLGSLIAFVFPLLLFLLGNFWIIPMEERRIAQTFGQQFVEYKQRVRRWL